MKTTTSYNLTIRSELYQQLQNIAEQEATTLADLLRRATKLFLVIRSIKKDPDARLLVERGGKIEEIILDLI
jgi:hypothetical protein